MLSLGLSQLSSSASKRDIAGSFVAGADDFAFTGSDAVGVWLNGHGSCQILLKNPFDWVHITVMSVLINLEICLLLYRVEQFSNLVNLFLETKNKKHLVYA
jgi:hypothetical protein